MPVVMVQKEVKKNAPASLEVLVDDRCAVENIRGKRVVVRSPRA